MNQTLRRFLLLTLSAGFLQACSSFGGDEEKQPLPGERVSILELQERLEAEQPTANLAPFQMPPAWRNEFWPQVGGYPNHVMHHLALNEGALQKLWSAEIGEGATKSLPLIAQPVVVDGRVFTVDSRSVLSAFSTQDGSRLWEIDVSDQQEDDPVIGGGVAYSRGRLYVTTGYDEVLSISPTDGSLIWRARIPSAVRAAPTILDDRLYISTLDNRLLAMDGADGKIIWEYTGLGEGAGLVGAASPAVGRDIVVPAFSSGEIFALRLENGAAVWSENLSSLRTTGGISGLSDIRGLPVIEKGLVIAVSFGGRMVAIDERTGNRVWQKSIGSAETPWIAGDDIFVLSNESELVSLKLDSGAVRWILPLPRYKNAEEREDPIYWTGPVLAGGRLIIAGTNGDVVEVNPADDRIIKGWKAGESFSISPVVAGGVLYLLDDNGTLSAYQ